MTTQEAIKLLESIPEEEFITNYYTNGKSKCCATGHLWRLLSKNPNDYNLDNFTNDLHIVKRLDNFTMKYVKSVLNCGILADINNCKVGVYQQETPKQRVMAALHDILNYENNTKN